MLQTHRDLFRAEAEHWWKLSAWERLAKRRPKELPWKIDIDVQVTRDIVAAGTLKPAMRGALELLWVTAMPSAVDFAHFDK